MNGIEEVAFEDISDLNNDDLLNVLAADDEAIAAASHKEEEIEAAVEDVETDEARAESYDEQSTEATDIVAATPVAADEPKSKRVSTKGLSPSEIILAKCPEFADHIAVDLDAADAAPKKVGEKIVNLVHSKVNGVNLSVYTKIAVEFLAEKGNFELKELRNHYQTGVKRPYSAGTAGAQASQMMRLLPLMGVATRSGNTLSVVEGSLLEWILSKENSEAAEEAA